MIFTLLIITLGTLFYRLFNSIRDTYFTPGKLETDHYDDIQPTADDPAPAAWQPDSIPNFY